jgi:hypothetical protein
VSPTPPPAGIEGLDPAARAALELVARLHGERGRDLRLADLPSDFLYDLAKDPPGSEGPRLGAAVAVRTLRAAVAAGRPAEWPARVDPADPGLRREAYRLAALAVVALTGRTNVGVSGADPEARDVLEVRPEDDELVEGFIASEEEILRRKRRVVDYPPAEFLEDLEEVPRRLKDPSPILPEETEPRSAGPYRFVPNHGDRVVRLYDFFRDKYGSPRGERRVDLYLAVLGYLSRHRARLEQAGEVGTDDGGRITFRDGFLEDLLRRTPSWLETA